MFTMLFRTAVWYDFLVEIVRNWMIVMISARVKMSGISGVIADSAPSTGLQYQKWKINALLDVELT